MRRHAWAGLVGITLSCATSAAFGFEPWEHRDAGDKGFAAAWNGLAPSDRSILQRGLASYFQSGGLGSFLWVGPTGTKATADRARWFSYGDLIATYGDFRETVDLLRDSPVYRLTVLQQIARGDFKPSAAGGDGVTDIAPKYIARPDAVGDEARAFALLAQWNETHFSEVAVATYEVHHKKALDLIGEAVIGKSPQKFLDALHYEALGHHGLTDIFAAGHMMVDRRAALGPLKAKKASVKGTEILGFLGGASLNAILARLGGNLADFVEDKLDPGTGGAVAVVKGAQKGGVKGAARAGFKFLKKTVSTPKAPAAFAGVSVETKVILAGLDNGSAHIGYNHKGYKVAGLEDENALSTDGAWYSFGDGEYEKSLTGVDPVRMREKVQRAVELSVRSLFRAYLDLSKFHASRPKEVKARIEQWKASRDAFPALRVVPVYVANPDGTCAERQQDLVETVYDATQKSDAIRAIVNGVGEAKFMTNVALGYCAKTPTKLPYYALVKNIVERPSFTDLCNKSGSTDCDPAPEPGNGLVFAPLKLFWSGKRGDNFLTATAEGIADAIGAEYTLVEIEGRVLSAPQPGTIPLKTYWGRGRDNMAAASAEGAGAAKQAGYSFVRTEGYIYEKQEPNTIPLKLYWSESRGDNMTVATAKSEGAAKDAGYKFVRVEGYVLPP